MKDELNKCAQDNERLRYENQRMKQMIDDMSQKVSLFIYFC